MSTTARRLRPYIKRAPRYVLNANDNRFMRFARESVFNRTYTTEIVNLSETGMAFVVDRSLVPDLGEQMKIEFTPPNQEQIAWFARVVRIELPEDISGWKIQSREARVALQFENLPPAHLQAIRHGLREQFERLAFERKMQTYREIGLWLKQNASKIAVYAAASLIVFSILYSLTRPSPNYDAKHPVPWGERKF